MIQTAMMQVLVTLWVAGHPVAQERLPEVYRAIDNMCETVAEGLRARVIKDADVTVECVPAERKL